MVVPIIPVVAGASFALNSIYSAGKAIDNYRYWNDYYRNTGFRPRYKFRSGYYDYLQQSNVFVGGIGRTYSGMNKRYYR